MLTTFRRLIPAWFYLSLVALGAACGSGIAPEPFPTTDSTTTTTGTGGMGGTDLGPCGVDCSTFQTLACTTAVCNTGQVPGPLNTCVVVPSPNGTPCDDGLFCTSNDTCNNGTCTGGVPSTCGLPIPTCTAVICYEESKSCDVAPVDDGAPCQPEDLCTVNGTCHIGECKGEPKDCSFSPLAECNKVSCNPANGKCEGVPDANKDDAPCVLTGELCKVQKTCKTGVCGGGVPKDCSALNVGCEVGVCDAPTGICMPDKAPVGTACSDGIPSCHVGACDVKGDCKPATGPDGIACNDHNGCTKADTCSGGMCVGGAVGGCQFYFQEGFESCPNGWTLSGDWQCGVPMNVGPAAAHTGMNVIGTQIAGNYNTNQSFDGASATSPPINLSQASKPQISFWAWDHTEGGSFDGWKLRASINGGQSFTDVASVTPAYSLMILGKPAWGGDHEAAGWQPYTADLSPYIGHSVLLRFSFRSDGAGVFPGVYIDDIVVAEADTTPIFITTKSPLDDVYAGMAYSQKIERSGGSPGAIWSIKQGVGVNNGWLSIDPVKGVLSGNPKKVDVGPVSVTVHVEEPTLPSNFDEKTYTFEVKPDAYYTSFELACPNGWTLTGDWQCGVPMNVGPATAYVGSQCIATQIAGEYHNEQPFATTTATSPDIDLTGIASPILTFHMWVDTEGSTYDGVNLRVSNDGGMNYNLITDVSPMYELTISNELAWGGHKSALGWQQYKADLGPFSGQTIRIRFAFESDHSQTFPGVYIDDVLVN
ncbi:MAG: hypothetical protein U0359_03690 [Byssovorax sp.]